MTLIGENVCVSFLSTKTTVVLKIECLSLSIHPSILRLAVLVSRQVDVNRIPVDAPKRKAWAAMFTKTSTGSSETITLSVLQRPRSVRKIYGHALVCLAHGTPMDQPAKCCSVLDLSKHVGGNEYARAQVNEFAILATGYQNKASRLESLRSRLLSQGDGELVSLRKLFIEHGIYDKARMQLSLSGPLRDAIETFSSSIYNTVEKTMDPTMSTHKCNRNGVLAHSVIQGCTTILMNACERLVLFDTNMSVEEVTAQTLTSLDDLWNHVCGITIENERAALTGDLEHLRKLAALVLQANQMVANQRDKPNIFKIAKEKFAKVAHMHCRVASDPWFKSHHVPSAGIKRLAVCSSAPEKEASNAFFEWASSFGKTFHDALVLDCDRIERLLREPAQSIAWHNVAVVESSDGLECATTLMPPSYLRRFTTSGGKTYIKNERQRQGEAHDISVRAIACARAVKVVRTLVERGWLPLNLFCKKYVDALIDAEVRLYSDRTVDIVEHLSAVCNESGYAVSEAEVSKIIADMACKNALVERTPAHGNDTESGSSTSSSASASSSNTASTSSLLDHRRRRSQNAASDATPVSVVQFYNVDHLVPPQAIDNRAFRVNIGCVHSFAVFEYAVICALARIVWTVVDRSRLSGISEDMVFSSVMVVSETTNILQHDGDILSACTRRVLTSHASVVQTVSLAIRKVMTAGRSGFDASERAKATGRIMWDAEYDTDAHSALCLRIGRGSRDPMGVTFLELCLRLKAHLDEGWPLPMGVSWAVVSPRRGKRS